MCIYLLYWEPNGLKVNKLDCISLVGDAIKVQLKEDQKKVYLPQLFLPRKKNQMQSNWLLFWQQRRISNKLASPKEMGVKIKEKVA